MGGESPIRSLNPERSSELESGPVKQRWTFRVSKLTTHEATILWSITSQRIQLRSCVIVANKKDIMLNFAYRKINNYTMEVARVGSLQGCYQKVSVIPNPKEAFDENGEWRRHAGLLKINEVEDVLPSLSCKRCYPRCPRSHTLVKE